MENMKKPMELIKEWAVQGISEVAGREGNGCFYFWGEVEKPLELIKLYLSDDEIGSF